MKSNNKKQAIAQSIEISKITTSKLNPRKFFDTKSLAELAESIKVVGVIQPITVRKKKKTDLFEIVCGERRYRAAQLAGLLEIPAVIRQCSDSEFLDISFSENIHREDVSEVETAEAIKAFIDNRKEDFKSMAARLGKSEKYVRDRYILNNLIDPIKELLNAESITVGKAVLLAAYSHEQQQEVYEKFLDASGWNSIINLKYKDFANRLDNLFNTDLSKAIFDLSGCEKCPFNSASGSLFPEDGINRCLNRTCFSDKTNQMKISEVEKQLNENPDFEVVRSGYSVDWMEKAITEKGGEIVDLSYTLLPEEPEAPEKPKEEDYIDEETGKVDSEEWAEAQQDYTQDMQDYQESLEEYWQDLRAVNEDIESGKAEYCYVLRGTELQKAIVKNLIDDDNTEASAIDLKATEKAEIQKLKEKDKRNQEIKIENTLKDLKESVLLKDREFTKTEGVKLEQDILFYYLIRETHREVFEKWFGTSYPDNTKTWEFVTQLTAEHRTVIIRHFIISKLRESACSSTSVDTQLLLEFCKHHFEKETLDISFKYQQVYDKRKASINEKIREIKEVNKVIEVATEEA